MIECVAIKAFNMAGNGRIEPGTTVELIDEDFVRLHDLGCVKTGAEIAAEQEAEAEQQRIAQEAEDAAAAARDAALAKAKAKIEKAKADAEKRKAEADIPGPPKSRVKKPTRGEGERDTMPDNLSSTTVDDAKGLIEAVTDIEVLRAWTKAELGQKTPRKSLLALLDDRANELTEPTS